MDHARSKSDTLQPAASCSARYYANTYACLSCACSFEPLAGFSNPLVFWNNAHFCFLLFRTNHSWDYLMLVSFIVWLSSSSLFTWKNLEERKKMVGKRRSVKSPVRMAFTNPLYQRVVLWFEFRSLLTSLFSFSWLFLIASTTDLIGFQCESPT